ncbi:hypothetical protein [Peribacillus simplex]|uniref:hypothetical protein n=1 Tax=Peribacillus simplex TaxID=1478 RepID=UPI003D2BAC7F
MKSQIKSIQLLYSRPFFNKYFFHSKMKPLLWGLILIIAVPFILKPTISDFLINASLKEKILIVILESLIFGILKSMNELKQQMYGDPLLKLSFLAAVRPRAIILGQMLAKTPFYLWGAFIITIPLTFGYSFPEVIYTGFLLFVISFILQNLVDVFSRFMMILVMKYMPGITKFFYVFSIIGNLLGIGLLIWALLSFESLNKEQWDVIANWTQSFSLIFLTLFLITLLFLRKLEVNYFEGWLKLSENQKTLVTHTTNKLPIIVLSPTTTIMFKDIKVIWGNVVTKIRWGQWIVLLMVSLVCLKKEFLPFYKEIGKYHYAIGLSFLITLFVFGEVVSSLYQQEGKNRSLYAITGVSPFSALLGKVGVGLIYILLPVFIGILIFDLILRIGYSGSHYFLIFILSLSSVFVQLGISSLEKPVIKTSKEGDQSSAAMMEQVPTSLLSVISLLVSFILFLVGWFFMFMDYDLFIYYLIVPSVFFSIWSGKLHRV